MGNNTRFSMIIRWNGGLFIIDEFDTDYFCLMDLKAIVHKRLRLDSSVDIRMEGILPDNKRLKIDADGAVVEWLNKCSKAGIENIHVEVEPVNPILSPLVEDFVFVDGNDDTDESYNLSDDDSVSVVLPPFDKRGSPLLDSDFNPYSDIEDELYGSDYDGDRPYLDRAYRGKIYYGQKEDKIILERGMLFANVDAFREVIRDYVIQEGFEIVRIRNERTRFTAMCAAYKCEWYLHASTNSDDVTFEIKVYDGVHSCAKVMHNTNVTSTWIAKKMETQFRADPNLSYDLIGEYMITKYGVEPSRYQMYRAKLKAKEQIDGNHGKTYSKLRLYAEIVRKANPGTIAKLQVERMNPTCNPVFKRFFLCLDAMQKGFIRGCRPFIGMDGCHLKGPYGGVLLSAIALDGNNGIFPLAIAIVEAENRDSWTYFLQSIEFIIGASMEEKPLVLMTDRQKGLDQAIAQVFPRAEHRWCARHLYTNFRAEFPGILLRTLFWKAAKSYCEWEFKEAMEAIKKANVKAFEWLEKIPSKMWARSHFDPRSKSDHITNNMTESFNHWIGPFRSKPVLTLIESLVIKIMGKVHNKYAEGVVWDDNLTLNVAKKIKNLKDRTTRFSLVPAGYMEFSVNDNGKKFPVDLKKMTCICKFWDLTGLPCKHALCCISYLRHDVVNYCDHHFHKACYQLTYSEIIHPVPDLSMVETNERPEDIVLPPFLKRLPGRPRKNRRREAWEGSESGATAKRSSTVRCTNCKEFGHNKRTCQRAAVKSTKTAYKKRPTRGKPANESVVGSQPSNQTQISRPTQGKRVNEPAVGSQPSNQTQIPRPTKGIVINEPVVIQSQTSSAAVDNGKGKQPATCNKRKKPVKMFVQEGESSRGKGSEPNEA